MQRVLILGAGGFGREVLAWVKTTWDCRDIGFLDDNPQAGNDPRLRAPVIATFQAYQPRPDDLFLCAVGDPNLRHAMITSLKTRGGRFGTLIHPTALVAEGARIGEGVLICPFALISADAEVQDGAAIYYHSSIDHDATVGAWSQISAHCDITGGATLGNKVFMGSHACVLPRIKVGNEAVIGAGAVVNRDVPAGVKVVGVPAQPRNP